MTSLVSPEYVPTVGEMVSNMKLPQVGLMVRAQYWNPEFHKEGSALRKFPYRLPIEWIVLRYYDALCRGLLNAFTRSLTREMPERRLPAGLNAFVAWAGLVEE